MELVHYVQIVVKTDIYVHNYEIVDVNPDGLTIFDPSSPHSE
jgi:hypothetical protein